MPKRIAVVEDETELATLIDYNLRRHGYEPHLVQRLERPVKALEQLKPDLVLLDVMLPEVPTVSRSAA